MKKLLLVLLLSLPLTAHAGDGWWLVDYGATLDDNKDPTLVCVPVPYPETYIQARHGYNYSMVVDKKWGALRFIHLDSLKVSVFAPDKGVCYDLAADFMRQRIAARAKLINRLEAELATD